MSPKARKSSGKPRNRPNIVVVLTAGVTLLLAGWFLSGSYAGYNDFMARGYLEAWEYQNRLKNQSGQVFTPSTEQLASARRYATLATTLSPSNADFQLTLGNAYLWGSAQAGVQDWKAPALNALRQACALSPARPDLWVRLARAKSIAGEFDHEFDTALARGNQLGPWRPSSMYDIIETGLIVWPRLSSAARETVMSTIQRSQQWHPASSNGAGYALNIQQLVSRLHRNDEVCSLLPHAGEPCPFKAAPGSAPGQT
ncbi:tetratricopeptide repeat protein [Fluviicoccus keumensis]|uniref:tetratricopeptide repeat protein n=1 Tax=Fluviicoccus keumensis TaxID=1435465 RepID=UPI00102BDEBA|nr:hypothetical protein [Fluviicoccus keumensis]